LRHFKADGFERLHHRQQLGFITAGKRVPEHGGDEATPRRHGRRRAELMVDGLDLRQDAADFDHGVGQSDFM
jgi:hypothetical protein